jgi:hypothetical protein
MTEEMRMAVHLLLENKTNRKMEYDGSPPTTCGDDGGEEEGCPITNVEHDGAEEDVFTLTPAQGQVMHSHILTRISGFQLPSESKAFFFNSSKELGMM